jgi:glycosyltransferase involved in cell wall biosynthesis
MDRYAESLHDALLELDRGRAQLEQVRLPKRPPAPSTRLGAYWHRYPRYLAYARRTDFDVNHVLDHAYGHLLYALDGARSVVTCHDIFPLKHWKGEIKGLQPRSVPPVTVLFSLRGLRRARFVLAPSEATKSDLVRLVGVQPNAIQVVPYGVDPAFRPFDDERRRELLLELPLAGPDVRHLLVVDSGAPYKNQRAPVEALARVVATMGRDVRLVRAGVALPEAERRLADSLGVADLVLELGAVGRDVMPALYNRCDVLVFPSFYEGFGWPPLEAMACGLPVVCSRWGSLLEVVDDAAATAPAEDYDALASHVIRILAEPAEAAAFARRGVERAARFTWGKNAERTADAYCAIVGRAR